MGIKLTRIILMVFTAVILVITGAAGPAAGGEPPYQAAPAESLNGLQTGEPYVLFVGVDRSPFGVFPYRMNPDGSNKQLFESDQLDYSRLNGAMELSPDGRTLAYTSSDEEIGHTIYLLDLATGTSSKLPLDTYDNGLPRWSPDGQTIAYRAEGLNGRLNAVDFSTGQTRELLNASIFIQVFGETGRVNSFDWSPDGSQLIAGMNFDPSPEGTRGVTLVLVNADGSNPRPLTMPDIKGWSPTWGHAGDRIYYSCLVSDGENSANEICAIDLATLEITQLSYFNQALAGNYRIDHLDISPDNRIVFELSMLSLPIHETPDIYRFDVATGEWANLTLDLDIELYGPRWVYPPAVPPIASARPAAGSGPPYQAGPAESLNGLQTGEPYVLFRGLENSPFGVFPYRMNPDGSNKQLFESDQLDYSRLGGAMEVSPDGRTLAYTSTDEESGDTIYLLDLATGMSSKLPLDTHDNGLPRWSPDGQTIAYLADGLNGDFNAVDLSTGQTRELLNARIFYQIFGRTGRVKGFDWSPDGSQLIASMNFDPSIEGPSGRTLVLVNADGSNPRPLTTPYIDGWSPTWGHDGDRIYYSCLVLDGENSANEICAIDLATLEITQLSYFNQTLAGNYGIRNLDISPDNRIVFELSLLNLPIHETPDIYRFDVATGEWANLTLDLDIELYGPRWVYPPAVPPVASAGPDQTVIDADSSGSEVVTLDGSASSDQDNATIPASNQPASINAQTQDASILFIVRIGGRPVPYTMGFDGTNKQPLSDTFLESDQLWAIGADLSPDGRTLAFGSFNSSSEQSFLLTSADLFLMDLATSSVVQLPTENAGNYRPVWSPDGTELAYLANAEAQLLRVINTVTGETQHLLTGQTLIKITGTNGRITGFNWSPSGNQLAASVSLVGPEANPTIFLTGVDGTGIINVLPNDIDVFGTFPSWGNQEDLLYFVCHIPRSSESPEICTIDLNTLQINQITNLANTFTDYYIANIDISGHDEILIEIHDRDSGRVDIYRYDTISCNLKVLTADLDNVVGYPRWVYPPAVPPVANAGPDQTVTDADSSGSEPGG